jgi:hypothetical protein
MKPSRLKRIAAKYADPKMKEEIQASIMKASCDLKECY